MPLITVHDVPSAEAALPKAPAIVVVAVYNAFEDVVQCYDSFLRHTPDDVPLLVVDDAGTDRRVVECLMDSSAVRGVRTVVVLSQPSNKGYVHGMNDAFAATGRSDVVLLNSDVVVGPEWFERLRDAAYSSNAVATSSALTNHGTILSVPQRNESRGVMPGDLPVDEAARRVATLSKRSRPRIPTAVAHCSYVKRVALDLVGVFDPVFSPGYSEEVDFCQRLVCAGMQHVCADDVFVYHRGGSTFGRSPAIQQLQEEHERIIKRRYPYYHPWVQDVSEDRASPLAAAILTARVSLLGLRVAVDGMCLGPNIMGTQVVVLETVRALAERDRVTDLAVYIPESCPPATRALLTSSTKVRLVPMGSWTPTGQSHHDLVYRPYQVNFSHELTWLRSVAERVVVNQLDLIAYNNGSYFSSSDAWRNYRRLASQVADTADGLAFISRHALSEAEAAGLLASDTLAKVVYCGTEHVAGPVGASPATPPQAGGVAPGFLLFLGASYGHKNRTFALRLYQALRAGGWTGQLITAGPTPPSGSTLADEAQVMLGQPDLAQGVLHLGPVSDAEKAWLYSNASLVLYPTVAEGFGMVPFEAAMYGVPCLSTRQGSLDEVLPPDIPVLRDWDLAGAVDLARSLIDDSRQALLLVEAIRKQGTVFTWTQVAADLEDLFLEAMSSARSRDSGASVLSGDAPRRTRPRANRLFTKAVMSVVARPDLKLRLSPPGSRRETLGRQVIRQVGSRL